MPSERGKRHINRRLPAAIAGIAGLEGRYSPADLAGGTVIAPRSVMDAPLTAEELGWLGQLDTDAPIKPELPGPVGERLVHLGLAITLVEGGLQLTALGRERLSDAKISAPK